MGRSDRKPHRDKRRLRRSAPRRTAPARPRGSTATPARSLPASSENADDEPSRLARAFRAGDSTALAALYQLLQGVMAPTLAYYVEGPGMLPTTIEFADLDQECWLILADLVKRWRPTRGSFAAFFRSSFAGTLHNYVRRHSASRWARRVQVRGAEEADAREGGSLLSESDAPAWDHDLAWSERLDYLTEREQAVLLLHFAEQKTFTEVAQALQMTRPAAFRIYRRAIQQLRGAPVWVGRQSVLLDVDSLRPTLDEAGEPGGEGDLLELVRALHAGARTNGLLPGRHWLMDRTGISGPRLSRLLALLADAGCIYDRAPRRAGRLVHATPQETLAALGVRTPLPLR